MPELHAFSDLLHCLQVFHLKSEFPDVRQPHVPCLVEPWRGVPYLKDFAQDTISRPASGGNHYQPKAKFEFAVPGHDTPNDRTRLWAAMKSGDQHFGLSAARSGITRRAPD